MRRIPLPVDALMAHRHCVMRANFYLAEMSVGDILQQGVHAEARVRNEIIIDRLEREILAEGGVIEHIVIGSAEDARRVTDPTETADDFKSYGRADW